MIWGSQTVQECNAFPNSKDTSNTLQALYEPMFLVTDGLWGLLLQDDCL